MYVLKPGDRIENYEIVKLLGKGSMGRVYLANRGGSSYAIKETLGYYSEEERSIGVTAFIKEAEFLERVSHPALPKYYSLFNYKNKKYLVMEYIGGVSMEKMIESAASPFRDKLVLYWSIQLCEILFYLHTLSPEPVIYRDLKPSNLMVTNENIIRVIDFGVARRYDPSKDSDTIRLGTPGYAAPEQCRRQGQSTPRSDIYALGIVMHQLLTLHDPSITPFQLPSVKKLNPSVSEQLENIINKATGLKPADRYLDAELMRDELLNYYKIHFGPYSSPYRIALPFSGKEDPLVAIIKNSRPPSSGFSKTLSKAMLPLAGTSIGIFIYLFLFRPDIYLCFLPLVICFVAVCLLFREFIE